MKISKTQFFQGLLDSRKYQGFDYYIKELNTFYSSPILVGYIAAKGENINFLSFHAPLFQLEVEELGVLIGFELIPGYYYAPTLLEIHLCCRNLIDQIIEFGC